MEQRAYRDKILKRLSKGTSLRKNQLYKEVNGKKIPHIKPSARKNIKMTATATKATQSKRRRLKFLLKNKHSQYLFDPVTFFGSLRSLIPCTLAGFGFIPSLDTLNPSTTTSSLAKAHLLMLTFRFALSSLSKTQFTSSKCCFSIGEKIVMLSIYTTAIFN